MLDPVSSIAFEMQAGKGMFALLLGSGVSRSAKIPTGWDITLDLVRRVAALRGDDAGADPAAWYASAFGKAPDYSELLDVLATTQTLRQQVVRPYIEPSDEERARGEKLPTAAHRAIANLMAKGYVRVVLTTNFDPLLEQALAEIGVNVTVIASADHVAGALPLVHAGPTIVKLHGDYLDTRIRNTLVELSDYEPAINDLLDQIFDQFGLIICGWSGEWDVALKAAIDRAPTRRFPTYWASRGAPASAARALIERRGARAVQIDGADGFFDMLEQRIQAIEALRRPHPLSTDIAVAMLKEYLPEERHQIRLHDLLTGEFGRALDRLNGLNFSVASWDPKEFARQAAQYSAATEPLLPLAFTAGMWSNGRQAQLWQAFIAELAERRHGFSGVTALVDLRSFPASLVFYAFCFGALVGGHLPLIGELARKIADFGIGKFALGDALNIASVITDGGADRFKLLTDYANKRLPGSELIANTLRSVSKHVLRGSRAFDDALARLEMALAFGYAERMNSAEKGWFWAPPGRFLFDRELRDSLISLWRADYEARTLQSDLCVMAGLKQPPRFAEVQEQWKLPF
ncbi:SIR2 family protein [Paraburkholderia aspalathi]|uniref:SIR2-like domain-containing protein n=1 Tax=Paraburkholderia aspalathi TaxID=1324617 RepID=A0A1I7ENP5_9BURK|nr:SIR2 family protein [Paraburkholderia aspalathi]SFU25532.1 SIR2-like domain-containing protein [Paraburkholderia aspalathi]